MEASPKQQADVAPEDGTEHLSLDLVAVMNLTDDTLRGSSLEQRIAACGKLTTIRLDELQLRMLSAEVLALLWSCKRLYLQHNCLTTCRELASLPQLSMLVLANNSLQHVEGLQNLTSLLFLDVSYNMLEQLHGSELPGSIKFLNIEGNPCGNQPGLLQQLVVHLPKLNELNGRDITTDAAAATAKTLATFQVDDASAAKCKATGQGAFNKASSSSSSSTCSDDLHTDDGTGQPVSTTINIHLAGLQQLEQEMTARASVAFRNKLDIATPLSNIAGARQDTAVEQAPAAGSLQQELSWVADARCSQDLARRIILSATSRTSTAADECEAGAQLAGRRLHGELAVTITSPTALASLQRSVSANARTSAATQQCSRQHCRRCTVQQSGSIQKSLQCRGPKVLSRPLSASSVVHMHFQSQLVTGGAASTTASDSSHAAVRQQTGHGACTLKLSSQPIGSGQQTQPVTTAAAPGQLASQKTNSTEAGSNSAKVATKLTQAHTSRSVGKLTQHYQHYQHYQARNGSSNQVKQTCSSCQGQCRGSSSSSNRIALAGTVREQGTEVRSKQPNSATAAVSRSSKRCSSSPSAMSKISHRNLQGEKEECAEPVANPTAAAAAAAAATSAAQAAARQGALTAAPPPRRLPSLGHAASTPVADASLLDAATSVAAQAQQPQHGFIPSTQSRPASATAVKLAPVQHPALLPVYEQRLSRNSSRPSTASPSANSARNSSVASSNGSERVNREAHKSPLDTEGKLSSCRSSLQLSVTEFVSDRSQVLQGCASTGVLNNSGQFGTIASEHMLYTPSVEGNKTAVCAGLDALAAEGRAAISSAVLAMQQRMQHRMQQLQHQQQQDLELQKQQLQQGMTQLKQRAATALLSCAHKGRVSEQLGDLLQQVQAPSSNASTPSTHADPATSKGLAPPLHVLSSAMSKLSGLQAEVLQPHRALSSKSGSVAAVIGKSQVSSRVDLPVVPPPQPAADVAGRIEQLRARLVMANVQLQEAAAAANSLNANAETHRPADTIKQSSMDAASYFSSINDTAGLHAVDSVPDMPQPETSAMAAWSCPHSEEASGAYAIDVDADIERVIATVFKPCQLPDINVSTVNSSQSQTSEDAIVAAVADIFKTSLPSHL